MIKNAFIVPHSPILIPAVGKVNNLLLQKTTLAYKKIEEKLIAAEIDLILIISPHTPKIENGFGFNIAPKFNISFKDFGDFAHHPKVNGDLNFAHELKDNLKKKINLKLTSQTDLDYGSAIPLFMLEGAVKNAKIISLPHSSLSLMDHFNFGKILQSPLIDANKNIAIIASGDLSHRLKRSAPGGYSPKGAKFDNKMIEYLNSPKTAMENIAKFEDKFISDVMECGLKSIALLLGLLDGLNYEPQMLAYQTELGIGYLTMDMGL
jgi:aromatic ring-opening dioxygenase LigB subunit